MYEVWVHEHGTYPLYLGQYNDSKEAMTVAQGYSGDGMVIVEQVSN